MVDTPTVAAPVVAPVTPTPVVTLPLIEAQAKLTVVAVLKFFWGLLSSGITAVAGGAWNQVTVPRVVLAGLVVAGLWFGNGFLKSDKVSSITREFTTVSQELKGIGEKLDVTNEKLGGIEELTAKFARVPVPQSPVEIQPAPTRHWFVKKPKVAQ